MLESTPSTINVARFPEDAAGVRGLFTEYIDSLGFDLSFQNVEAELRELPGKYAPPLGNVLLACGDTGQALGCIALRPTLVPGTGELKRLYVRPEARGQNLGRRLVLEILKVAKNAGYEKVVLDTVPSMGAALRLYASLGFGEIEAYYHNPFAEAIYLGREL